MLKVGTFLISVEKPSELLVITEKPTNDCFKVLNTTTEECFVGLKTALEDESRFKVVTPTYNESHLEQFEKMLRSSEFGSYFSKSDGSINYEGADIETTELIIAQNNECSVSAVFCKSDESYITTFLEERPHKCSCGNGGCHGSCNCGSH